MADSYHIIDGKVVPYCGGRKCNDTDAWRDATQLELQLQEQLEEYEHTIAALQDEVERLVWAVEERKAEVESLRALCAAAYQMAGVHDAPVEWLDALSNAASGWPFSTDGLLPYMPQAVCNAEVRALDLEREGERVTCELMDAITRADKLAEALRELVEVFSESGMYDEEVFAKARAALAQEQEAGRG